MQPTYSNLLLFFLSIFCCCLINESPQQGNLIWQMFIPNALPHTTPKKGFVSPPGIRPGSFCLLGECVNLHYRGTIITKNCHHTQQRKTRHTTEWKWLDSLFL